MGVAGAAESTSIGALVVFGTATSLLAKIIYEIEAPGRDGKLKPFEKPWACTAMMFVGMTFCLPIAYWVDSRKAAKKAAGEDASSPLLGDDDDGPPQSLKSTLMLAIPMALDLVATILLSVGLLVTTASVSQMLRGSGMLFAALFALTFLKRRLNKLHYIGIALSFVGMGIVGASSLLSGQGGASAVDPTKMAVGMALIVLSQAVQAAQCTAEDYFLSEVKVEPLMVVGFEGLFGVAAMALILAVVQFLPGREGGGLREDSVESWQMIRASPALQWVTLGSIVAYLGYNTGGMFVTDNMGAVTRTVLETMRTLFVWVADLALYYSPLGGSGKVGEQWDSHSWMQAAGFAVLAIGTVVYARGDEGEDHKSAAAADVEGAPAPKKKRYPRIKGGRTIGLTGHARSWDIAERFIRRLQLEVSHHNSTGSVQSVARRWREAASEAAAATQNGEANHNGTQDN